MPSKQQNVEMWDKPWTTDGDEFHQFATERGQDYWAWKRSLVETFIRPNVRRRSSVLEIGCGRGRWSEFFVGRVRKLTLVDISASCLEICRQKFGDNAARYILSGGDLSTIADASIDFVWSFDVFVHIDAVDFEAYIYELKRVMKPGATAILHHGDDPNYGGWRASDVTAAKVRRMVESAGLITSSQFDSWGPNNIYSVKHHQDIISLLSKPSEKKPNFFQRMTKVTT